MSKQPSSSQVSRTLCALLAVLLQSSLAFAACILPTPAQQMAFVPLITESMQPNPPFSYGVVTLGNVPPGFSVTNGNYLGWSTDPSKEVNPGVVYNPIMYDTYDLAGLASIGVPTEDNVWNKINYIINHKPPLANNSTIQAAIWRFINFSAADEAALVAGVYVFGFPPADLATIDAIEADANANGAAFVPGPTDLTAIYLDFPIPPQASPQQPFIIEVLCPDFGSIGDTVFCDLNENGIQDPGDLGIPNVQVDLLNAGGIVINGALTDANGKYLFNDLPAGTYTVSVVTATLPPDCNEILLICPPSRTVNLAAGQHFLEADFCFGRPPGSIGDTVFCDLNENGVQDPGDLGIPSVQVDLLNAGGIAINSALTDANGQYLFTDLPAGTYTVSVNTATLPPDCNQILLICPPSKLVNLGVGQTFLDADFCFGRPPGSIGDTVFCDLNENGVQDPGDLGILNVQVDLLNAGGIVINSAFTDANGQYLFTDLPAGSYTVSVITATLPPDCNQILLICPPSRLVNLGVGQAFLDADFCFGRPPGSIGDTVFCDQNENGVQDPGDLGIPNVQVDLLNAGGIVINSAFTDANGKYLFTGLPAGTYMVSVNTATLPPDCNRVLVLCPITKIVDLGVGQIFLDADFCFGRPPGSIGDTVFCDLNENGIQEAGDLGIPNVQVDLLNAGGIVINSAFTDANGKYLFTDQPTGTYTVSVNTATLPPDCNKVLVLCPITEIVNLGVGQIFLDADFCFGRTLTLCVDGIIGGIDLSGLINNYLFFFANGKEDAKWQGATKGFVGNVLVDGVLAKEQTSGGVPYAGTIVTNASTLGAWQSIVNQNSGQAFASTGNVALVSTGKAKLLSAFAQINALPVTAGFANRSSTSLNGLNTQDGIAQTIVINVTSGFGVSSKIYVMGDASDVFILRWDTDSNAANGYHGQVKFQSGGAIVPLGGLKASNFIHVAGDINASGGGSNPPAPYPQGPRLNNGTGALINGGQDFSGGGFFTGYWLTTGTPKGDTHSLSNAIFVGGWYTLSDKFSLTSGTSGVYVAPNCP